MSRANQHSRTGMQRLRGGVLAPPPPGSLKPDPRALRSERLQWQRGCTSRVFKCWPTAKIAAFPAVLRPIAPYFLSTAARAGAKAGAVPPFSQSQPPEGAMR